jgi:3-hydroxyisobutyrate dehydrogenase-like beta-hydroxyacid dehydrogenase
MRVAFLGLGTMGAPMARNVARRGHELVVWNRTAGRAAALAAELAGVRTAQTPADAARGAEVVITMLSDPPALRAVVAGEGGLLAAMAPGTILVDMSTVDPATVRDLAKEAQIRGVTLIDAPVSGSRKPAIEGTLVIMAAGDAAAIERARPVLEAMGRVKIVGPSGAGSAMKLVLNGLGAHLLAGHSAALVLAQALGLDPALAIEVVQMGAFSSPLFAAKTPKVLARDFSPDFSVKLMLKDQDLVLATARAAGVSLPTLEAVREALIVPAMEAGLAEEDLSAVVQVLEKQAGITVKSKT